MKKLIIKPLSTNRAYRSVKGRMLKSREYIEYERELFYMLPNDKVPDGKLQLFIKVGLSSKLADVDNVAKPLIDILQKKYDFNDRMIYRLMLEKEDVKKGEEFIEFRISEYIEV